MCDETVSSARQRILRVLETCASEVTGENLLKALALTSPICQAHFSYAIDRLLDERAIRIPGQPQSSGKLGMKECLSPAYALSSEGAWILNDRWEVLDPVGRGGMADVYRGRQRNVGGRLVALKIPFVDHLEPAVRVEVIERTKREVNLLSSLSHPAIVAIYDADQDVDGMLYFVMELLEGGSLAERVKKRGRLPWEEVIDFLVPAADGLALASSRGIRHRDIKPQNLMFDASGRVRVTDFGLAKALPGSAPGAVQDPVTRIQAIRGTLQYMAPERLRQLPGADESERADIYSFGVTLYEALVGNHPYPGVDPDAAPLDVHYRLLMTHPVPLHEALSECPRELADAVDRMMAKEPDLRYPTFAALANDLKRIGVRAARRTTRISGRTRTPKTDLRTLSAPAAAGVAPAADAIFAAQVEAYDRAIEEACDALKAEFGPPAASPGLLRAIWTLAGASGAATACEALWIGIRGKASTAFQDAYEQVLRALETGGSLPPSAWLVPLDLGELLRVGRRQLEADRRKGQAVDPSAVEKLLGFLQELPDRKELHAWRLPPDKDPKDVPLPLPSSPATTSTAPSSTRRMAIRGRREAIDKLHREVGELVGAWFTLYGHNCFGWNSSNPKANELIERLFELAKERRLVAVLRSVRERLTGKPMPDFVELYERLLDFHAQGKCAPSDPAGQVPLEIPSYATQDLNQASSALADDREHEPAAARAIIAFLRDVRDHAALALYRLPQAPTRPPATATTSLPAGAAAPSPTDLAGRTLGDYELVEIIGKGGMGVVYRARDKSLERDVAVKVMSADVAAEDGFAERFQNEAKNAARLQHPNLVHVYRTGSEGGLLWYAMEFISSRQTLAAYMTAAGGPADAPRALGIARRVAEGLQVLHEANFVHRDIKPDNIMVIPGASDGVPQIKILDAGLLKPVSAKTGTRTTQFFMGTPEYCSPEQAREERVDGRSDLYSLGVILYELLAGPGAGRPYAATSPTGYLVKTADPTTPPVPLTDRNPAVSRHVAGLVHRLLAKNPDDRYPCAAGLIQAIDDVLDRRTDQAAATKHRGIRRRRGMLAGALALLLLALAAAYLPRLGIRPEPTGRFEVGRRPDPSENSEPPPSNNTSVPITAPAPDPIPSPASEAPPSAVTAPPPTRTFPISPVFGPTREDSTEEFFSRHVPSEEELRALERLLETSRQTLPARQAYDLDAGLARILAFEAKEKVSPWVAIYVEAERARLEAGRATFEARPFFRSKTEERTLVLRDGRGLRARVVAETRERITIEPVATGLREELPLYLLGPATFPAASGVSETALRARSAAGDAAGTLGHLEAFEAFERRRLMPLLVDQAIEEAFLAASGRRDMKALLELKLPEDCAKTAEGLLPARLRLFSAEREAARLYERRAEDPAALRGLMIEMALTRAARSAAAEILERWEKTLGATDDDNLVKGGLGDFKLGGKRYAWKLDTLDGRNGSIVADPKKDLFKLQSAGPEAWVWMSRLVDHSVKGYRVRFDLVGERATFALSTRPGRQLEISARRAALLRRVDENGDEKTALAKEILFPKPLAGGRIDVVPHGGLVILYLDGTPLASLPAEDWGLAQELDLGAAGGEVILSQLISVDTK